MRSDYRQLSDFVDVKGGKRLPKGKNLSTIPTTHPYIRVHDLGVSKTLELTSDYEYVDNGAQATISRYIVNADDVIISIVGTIGLVAKIGKSLDGANLTENCAKMVNIRGLDKEFLYYYLLSGDGQNAINAATVGAVQAKLPLKNIQAIPIPNVPLHEQRAIAATLSCLDDKIELNNKTNANLEAQAQAIFKSWFVDFESKEWQKGILSDIAYINPLRTLSRNSAATYVEMSNLPTIGSFPMGWTKREFTGGMKFRNGDTLIARITPCLENGKTAYVNFLKENEVAFGSTEYIVLAAKEGYPNELFYFLARDKDFINYAVKNMSGSSGRQRVSADVIGNYEMLIPPIDFVETYASFFVEAMDIIRINSFQSRTLAAIRDALLPKLMSGEIEVPIAE